MQIHISRNSENYGPYELLEINGYLKDGSLLTTDLAWYDGIPDWIPLSQVPGIQSPGRVPPPPPQKHNSLDLDGDLTIRRLADYERISGILWIVLAAIQILTVVGIIAGIWNILAGISRINVSKQITARDSKVPAIFESYTQLIVIGIINLLLGGIIGVAFVAFDFYIRDVVLRNARLFTTTVQTAAA
jgi:hypothetical protein